MVRLVAHDLKSISILLKVVEDKLIALFSDISDSSGQRN